MSTRYGAPGALNVQAFEGSFIPGGGPLSFMLAGPGSLVAGAGGCMMGRFGFADIAAGTVSNARTDAAQILGLVLPQAGNWTQIFFDSTTRAFWRRQGLAISLANNGSFWARFAGGAYAGQPCYANQTDGSAISGTADGAELTQWVVASNAPPGGLARISTTSFFGA